MRSYRLVFVAAAAGLALQSAQAQEARTTRIETRPVYGAVVTLEHGVRVYRPVPPTTHMIVNPDGAAMVILGSAGGGSTIAVPANR
jgi:hypothetical protein